MKERVAKAFKVRLHQSFAVGEMSWPGKVAALRFDLINLIGVVKKSWCFGEYGSVAALVAEMLFFGVAGVSERFAVVLWDTVVFANGIAVVGVAEFVLWLLICGSPALA